VDGPRPEGPKTIVVVVDGPVTYAGIPALCERFGELLEGSDADHAICDVSAVVEPDAVALEALTRLQLTATRMGRSMELHHPCRELTDILALAGLSDVLKVSAGLRLEAGRQPEHREQLRVDEVVDRTDPTV
jgi:ABC-type transporter Mla MlaB component